MLMRVTWCFPYSGFNEKGKCQQGKEEEPRWPGVIFQLVLWPQWCWRWWARRGDQGRYLAQPITILPGEYRILSRRGDVVCGCKYVFINPFNTYVLYIIWHINVHWLSLGRCHGNFPFPFTMFDVHHIQGGLQCPSLQRIRIQRWKVWLLNITWLLMATQLSKQVPTVYGKEKGLWSTKFHCEKTSNIVWFTFSLL